jgi:hypothetical protein
MNLITKVESPSFPKKIKYKDKLFFLGSCFADNIGKKMQDYRFSVKQNPFGVIFNPISISKIIELIIQNKDYAEENIQEAQELFFTYDFHSCFSAYSKRELQAKIQQEISSSHLFLKESDFLFISLGTAFAYERKESMEIVANCHKQPGNFFHKRLLSHEEVVASLQQLCTGLKLINPQLEIIFTISPVRHSKDGFHNNNLSKARLHLALEDLKKHTEFQYFPSYEILLDELRDYRFYAHDMLHPNSLAIDYIFESFKEIAIDSASYSLMQEIEEITKAVNHKLFYPKTKAALLFRKNLIADIEKLMDSNKDVDLADLLAQIKKPT